ncbi:hypothetical protein BV898_06967 [Hypsibius exemplaris]|uniref:Uncharacterized protein n=1 Tax=Hypsibius exemplaris TaxID=2072580 RepID=A0A1W0WUN3_HYPEX|nr:hypothetical protein BV898_06967 [Hypsibius exemplaris]
MASKDSPAPPPPPPPNPMATMLPLLLLLLSEAAGSGGGGTGGGGGGMWRSGGGSSSDEGGGGGYAFGPPGGGGGGGLGGLGGGGGGLGGLLGRRKREVFDYHHEALSLINQALRAIRFPSIGATVVHAEATPPDGTSARQHMDHLTPAVSMGSDGPPRADVTALGSTDLVMAN